ncbi:retron system putative HNH endonuclease [Polaromonas sp.]|uniref:retron system putative HNH endonuclease n=1 Tax=Polaromonas sp. TaxID=1869339 RepID=UPI001A304AF1|nr:TIGR02646 family protein [Comamonadaceae bacterium]
MKHVMKGASAPEFETWKALENPDWTPTYENLQNPQKCALHASLLKEQGWVCCYCGRSIAQQDSHIEHFRPQERYPDLALSFENLHASCIRETEPGRPLHCGHAKGAGFDEALHISPLNPECEVRFLYTSKGSIIPSEASDAQASYMVELLQLDIKFLCNRREEEVNRVFDPEFLATVTADELRLLRDAFRRRDEAGRAQSFGHVLARFSEQRLLDATP